MIDAVMVAKVITSLATCWAIGFGMGNAVAWVRKLRDVA